MVGDGNGIHPVFFRFVEHLINTDCAVQEAVFGVDVKMNKWWIVMRHFVLGWFLSENSMVSNMIFWMDTG
jgi:hypothetical protein